MTELAKLTNFLAEDDENVEVVKELMREAVLDLGPLPKEESSALIEVFQDFVDTLVETYDP
jgi:hypothetical protein